jgi:hypothetical protein
MVETNSFNTDKKKYISVISNLSKGKGVHNNITKLNMILNDIYTIIIQFNMSLDKDSIDNFLNTITMDDRNKKNNDGRKLGDIYVKLISEKKNLEKIIINDIGDEKLKESTKKTLAKSQKYYVDLTNKVNSLSGNTVDSDLSKMDDLIKIADVMSELKKYNNLIEKDQQSKKNTDIDYSQLFKKSLFYIVMFIVFLIIVSVEVYFGLIKV